MSHNFKVGVYGGLNITKINRKRSIIIFDNEYYTPIYLSFDDDEYFTLDYNTEFLAWGGSIDLIDSSSYRLRGDNITIYAGSSYDVSKQLTLDMSQDDSTSFSEIVPVEPKVIDIIENAETVHKRICDNFEKVERTLYDICVDLKTIRDNKYYKSLGYDTFEAYCSKEFNISRRQIYKYISVAENLSSEFVNHGSQNGISFKKMYVLSRLTESERTEILETTDIEHTPVKQVEQKAKEIKQAREVTKDDDTELSSQDKEMLDIINDFEDFMENADVEEIAKEHGITTPVSSAPTVEPVQNKFIDLECFPPFEVGKYFNIEISFRGLLDDNKCFVKFLNSDGHHDIYLDFFLIHNDQFGEYIIFSDTQLKYSGLDIHSVFRSFCVSKVENGNYYLRYYKKANVDEIAQEHGITLHQDDTSNVVVPAPVSQNDITSSIDFKEFCKGVHYSGSRGRSAIESTFTCYDGQDIKHNFLDYYTYFTKTLNNRLKSSMDSLDYEIVLRQLSDLIEVSKRLGDTLYDVKKSVEREIDKKKSPYLYDVKYFNKNHEPNKE